MPLSNDVYGAKGFYGVVQYLLSVLLIYLACMLESWRKLTKKQVPLNWTSIHEGAEQKVINKILQLPVLNFYNCEKDIVA